MSRSGYYVLQPTGYRAFIPSKLPPDDFLIDTSMHQLLSQANISLGRLDSMGYLLPNVDRIIAMYVRKEALLCRSKILQSMQTFLTRYLKK